MVRYIKGEFLFKNNDRDFIGFRGDMNYFQRYNWVDVWGVASEIFCNYSYMIHWAKDAWNLLIVEKPVPEQNIIPKELTDFEEVDNLLWLIALYDLFYDYQVKIDHEMAIVNMRD